MRKSFVFKNQNCNYTISLEETSYLLILFLLCFALFQITFNKFSLTFKNFRRYVENVFPGEFGVPRPWYFFVQKSYWIGETSEDEDYKFDDLEEGSMEDEKVKVEEEPKGYPLGVSIDKLSKIYGLDITVCLQ